MSPLVDFINEGNFTWQAELNERFNGLSLAELKDNKGQEPTGGKRNLAQTSAGTTTRTHAKSHATSKAKNDIDYSDP